MTGENPQEQYSDLMKFSVVLRLPNILHVLNEFVDSIPSYLI